MPCTTQTWHILAHFLFPKRAHTLPRFAFLRDCKSAVFYACLCVFSESQTRPAVRAGMAQRPQNIRTNPSRTIANLNTYMSGSLTSRDAKHGQKSVARSPRSLGPKASGVPYKKRLTKAKVLSTEQLLLRASRARAEGRRCLDTYYEYESRFQQSKLNFDRRHPSARRLMTGIAI